MNNDISKLISELTRLVKTLSDKAGVDNVSSNNILPGFTAADGSKSSDYDTKRQKVKTSQSVVSSAERNRWSVISKIFAKSFLDLQEKSKPNFGFREKTDKDSKVINVNVDQEKKRSKFWLLLGAAVAGLIATLGGLGLAIAAFFKGPGASGKILQMLGTGLIKLGSKILNALSSVISKWGDNILKTLKSGPLAKALSRIKGSGALGKIFTKLLSGMGKVFAKVLRFLPGVGALVSFWFAYKNFESGDWIGGVGELASGILSILTFIPGVGPIAGILGFALDVALLARYATKTEEERVEQSGKLGDIFKKMGSWIADKFKKHIDKLPVIGTFIHMYRAYTHFKDGNVSEGMDSLLQSLFPYIPDVASKIRGGWGFLKSLFSNEGGEETSSFTDKISNFAINAKEWIKTKLLKLPWFLRKPLEWFNIIDKQDSSGESSDLQQGATNVLNNIKQFFSPLDGVGEKIKNIIPDWDTIKESIGSGLDVVKSAALSASEAIKERWSIISNSFNTIVEQTKEKISSTAERVNEGWGAIGKLVNERVSIVKEKISETASILKDKALDLGSKFKSTIGNISSKLLDIGSRIVENIAKLLSSTLDISSKYLSKNDGLISKLNSLPRAVIDSVSIVSKKVVKDLENITNNLSIPVETTIPGIDKLISSYKNVELGISNNLAAMESLTENSIKISAELLKVNKDQAEWLQKINQTIASIPRGESQPNIMPIGGEPPRGGTVQGQGPPLDAMLFADITNNDLTITPSNV